jgi:hypothetical protein
MRLKSKTGFFMVSVFTGKRIYGAEYC